MYRHYETSDDVFVDREEHIEWMNKALERCKNKSVVLHLKGIGGIGKSSLLNHWINTHEKTIRLDCEQYSEFYQRLNILAKGAVLQGIKLERFDILWQIRQRFVEGVEPVKEEGRQWAKEVVMAIPFIGSLASIGSAINAVGAKVTPKLKGKYGTVGKWLQDTLGKNHIEQLLQILWKEPRRAEFLYLEAFLEDVNRREESEMPILFLLDHFEYVDDEKAQWKYRGQKISETQLWTVFLSLLSNCVGVLASRKPAAESKEMQIEETELLELDRESCLEMLELQGVVDEKLQERIVSVSGGNPFVIDSICDMINAGDVSISDIENLRADNLAEVRLKVWRRLFSHAEGLMDIINRAGLVPFFSREIMEMITPAFTFDLWNKMIRLSFVKDMGCGVYVLHDLAEDLVKAELGSRLSQLSNEVAQLLEKGFEVEEDYTLLGLSYAVQANDMDVCENLMYKWADFSWDAMFREGLQMLDVFNPQNEIAYAIASVGRGWFLSFQNRIAEGEDAVQASLESFRTMNGITDIQRNRFVAITMMYLGVLKHRSGKYDDAEEMLQGALELYQKVIENPPKSLLPGRDLVEEGGILHWLGDLKYSKWEFQEARQLFEASLEKIEKWAKIETQMSEKQINREVAFVLWYLGRASISMNQLSEAEAFSRRGLEKSEQDITVMNNLTTLGTALYLKGHFKEAREVHLKEIELAREMAALSTEFPVLLVSKSDLLSLQKVSGEYHQAIETIEELLALQKTFMEKAPEVYEIGYIEFHRQHGIILTKIGKSREAEKAYQKGIRLAREHLRKIDTRDEPILGKLLNDYGVLLHQTSKLQKALECFIEASEIFRQHLNELPELLICTRQLSTSLCNLGATMLEMDRTAEAEEFLREALLLRRKILTKAPEVFYYPSYLASSMNNLAVFHSQSNNSGEAEEYLTKAIDLRMKHRTEETSEVFDPGLVAALSNMGILRAQSGEISESKDTFIKAIATARELHKRNPETHRQTLNQVLSNMYVIASKDDAESDLASETLAELRQLGYKGITDRLEWFVETTEAF